MTNIYDQPDQIRLTATFTDAAGDVQDPTAAVIMVKRPDGTYISYKTSTGWADQGAWNAADNTPTLADGTGTAGHFYTNSAAASRDMGVEGNTQEFAVGDEIYYTGEMWRRIPSPSATTLTKDSTGVYYVDQAIGQSSSYYYRAEAAGTGQSGAESVFEIRESQF